MAMYGFFCAFLCVLVDKLQAIPCVEEEMEKKIKTCSLIVKKKNDEFVKI